MWMPKEMQNQILCYTGPSLYDNMLSNNFNDKSSNMIRKRKFELYLEKHTCQTVDFVQKQRHRFSKFNMIRLPIMVALKKLNNLIDESNPDFDVPNITAAFQTAEAIRRKHPEHEWFHLIGLIHELGKFLTFFGEPEWAVEGETHPVGCQFSKSIIHRDLTFTLNPDNENTKYTTLLGIYERGCGLENVQMSWGHDEYLHMVLRNHPGCKLPEEAFYIIRYKSFYPWHTEGDYDYLCETKDRKMLKWIQEFNRLNLNEMSEATVDFVELIPYYQRLIDMYIPGDVAF